MKLRKKLALVWGENDGDSPVLIVPLEEVTDKIYNENTEQYGTPRGRVEEFLDLSEHSKMEILKEVLEEAQQIDPNGTHLDVLEEIENGEVTLEEMIEHYKEVLQQWLEDSEGDKRIEELLKVLGE